MSHSYQGPVEVPRNCTLMALASFSGYNVIFKISIYTRMDYLYLYGVPLKINFYALLAWQSCYLMASKVNVINKF